MGTTYRAIDTVLHRAVALKVIERSVAEHPAARARFLREARAAAQFQHPNVAAVSHYGEQDGECFYAMELVEGETLEARVQRDGALPYPLALEIAGQVARALAAAEARGVIHRDLKPTNLMLAIPMDGSTPRDAAPTVKVIDFGLAKAVTAVDGAVATETRGGFVGTPSFASPEQFEASGSTRIDHRADIYSLGATLWYALAGRVPFTGRSLEEIHARQSDPLPTQQLSDRGVPKPVVALLASTLAVDPADRPQSARELLDALVRCKEEVAALVRPARYAHQRRALMALTLLLVIAAAAGGAWWWRLRADPAPGQRTIAVLPFGNLSHDPADAFFTTGVQDEITANLAHVAALKVIDPSSTRGYPPGKRDVARIGQELGVGRLLEGEVRREGGKVHVRVTLIDVQHPDRPWTGVYDRQLADVFIVQSEITRAIADQLETPLTPDEKNAIDEPPTTDLVAYDFYLRAGELPHTFTDAATLLKTQEKAIALLEPAVARDPRFVLAWCALEDAHDTMFLYRNYGTPEQRSVDHRTLAETALENARRLRPDAGEVHLAAARHFMNANRDGAQARIEADLARRTLPNNAELDIVSGTVARGLGDGDAALRFFQSAVSLEPRNTDARSQLADTYLFLRRYEESKREITALLTMLTPKDALAFRAVNALTDLARDANLTPLRASVAGWPANTPDPSNDLRVLTVALFEHDADALTRTLAAAPEAKFISNGCIHPRGWFEGLAARMRGDVEGARTAFAAARIDAEKAVLSDATNGLHLSMLAMIDAGLGRTEDAVREGRHACELIPPEKSALRAPRVACNLAVVYAWTGQPDLAIAELQPLMNRPSGNSLVIQPSYGDLSLNPVWDPLRGDQRFAALVAQLAPPSPAK